MARKKVESEAAIKSWSEVDIALRQIAECENLLIEQVVELNRRTAEVKEPQIIALLKQLGLLDCITTKEAVNKDVLKQKPPDIVSGVGACLSVKDGFGYETNREQLHAAEG